MSPTATIRRRVRFRTARPKQVSCQLNAQPEETLGRIKDLIINAEFPDGIFDPGNLPK